MDYSTISAITSGMIQSWFLIVPFMLLMTIFYRIIVSKK